MGLAALFFEIVLKEKFWWGFRPIWGISWQDIKISLKNDVFKFLEWVIRPGSSSPELYSLKVKNNQSKVRQIF